MTTLLHLDASARTGFSDITPFGSHTRRLSRRFVDQWLKLDPGARVIYRDVGQNPPPPVTGQWIHAAFTPQAQREPWMHDILRTSDTRRSLRFSGMNCAGSAGSLQLRHRYQTSLSTLKVRNSDKGRGTVNRQTMLMGLLPLMSSATTGPQAWYGSSLLARTNS